MFDNVSLKYVQDFSTCQRERSRTHFDFGLFANFVPHARDFYGACRHGNTSLTDNIQLLKYDKDLNLVESNMSVQGEDPRCFLYCGTPYALTWDPQSIDSILGHVFFYKVINLLDGEVTILDIDGFPTTPTPLLGKNWIPLERENKLYFVITIDPQICILECDLNTGKCTWETPIDMVKGDLQITISRGGTPLIFNEESQLYFGLGHRTYNCHNHSAFVYTLTKDFKTATIGGDIATEFSTGVNDPLSIFQKDDKTYCCIANFPIQAGDTLFARSSLYEVNLS
tara:strand:+ start:5175 stop:6023 length:849 start_codon:yes stop_codon:yes gene_type:complete